MAILMMICIIPTTAMAEENVYEVGDKDTWDQAVSEIEALPEGSDATVILTQHINHPGQYSKMYVGVKGHHVTYKSNDGGPYIIAASSLNMYANGDVTFEDVWLNDGHGAGV